MMGQALQISGSIEDSGQARRYTPGDMGSIDVKTESTHYKESSFINQLKKP